MFYVHNLNDSLSFFDFVVLYVSFSFVIQKIYVSLLFYLNQTRTYTFIDVRIDVLMWFSVLNFTKDNYFTYYSIYNNICFHLYVYNRFCVCNLMFLFFFVAMWMARFGHTLDAGHTQTVPFWWISNKSNWEIFTKIMKKISKKQEKCNLITNG